GAAAGRQWRRRTALCGAERAVICRPGLEPGPIRRSFSASVLAFDTSHKTSVTEYGSRLKAGTTAVHCRLIASLDGSHARRSPDRKQRAAQVRPKRLAGIGPKGGRRVWRWSGQGWLHLVT